MPLFESEGFQIFYTDRGQGGTPLLLIHGLATDSDDYAEVIAEFSGERRVVAFDRRGHGRSLAPANGEYTLGAAAAEAAALARYLRLPPAIVVGHSQGGRIAALLARDYPELVAGLFLYDSRLMLSHAQAAPVRSHRRRWLACPPGDEFRAFARNYFISLMRDTTPDWLRDKVIRGASTTPEHAVRGFLSDPDNDALILEENSLKLLQSLRCPVGMIMAGDILPAGIAAAYERVLPNVQVSVVPDCGHWIASEQPDRFNTALRRFIRSVEGTG